ncbi:MAG: BON domain-containing protein [Bacteroidia bacterium]
MKTDEQLKKDVLDAFQWQPTLKTAEIGVIAKDGVITLTGHVNNYAKKIEAENSAKNVAGVKAVAEEIAVKIREFDKKNDADIATEIVNAIKWNWKIPSDKVKVKVEQGWVTIGGDVHWNYQREATKKLIESLDGVKGVINDIKIKSAPQDLIEKNDILRALALSASVDEKEIQVQVISDKVILTGMVSSLYQKDEAERLAWNAPGVSAIDNQLVIDYYR